MNYNTNRTIQAVCAKALILQIYYSQGSCFSIEMAAEIAWLGFEYADKIQKDYRLHSGAYASQYGFFPFSLIEWTELPKWSELPIEAKQTYRLEMLYYFWLANQDGMDAFS